MALDAEDKAALAGKHYEATVTDRRGMTRGELAELFGLPTPSEPDAYDVLTIEYKARG
jgi:hypothetical protein